ncbi:MAG TPA: alpha/beta hydrolase [Verrucomicrobiae bacterium]
MKPLPVVFKTIWAAAVICVAGSLNVQAQSQTPIPLWPAGAPGALGTAANDIPTVTPYVPATGANGSALVICPGGGYAHLAAHEGNDYALWLNQHGITCFVLKYRLGSSGYHHPAMLNDAARAVRWVRAHATEYHVNPQQVGIMGSSAGGHLASSLMTHFDAGNTNASDPVEQQSSRPDIGILCYPVITMGHFTHRGSHDNLLGKDADAELVKFMSSEQQVSSNTPPCFIWTTYEDTVVPMENTLMFAEALRQNHVPFDLHVYQKGPHGMGLKDKPPFANPHPWAGDCLFWLKAQGFVN